jgi:KDO2-lipid IV(A) lauroyltransferase
VGEREKQHQQKSLKPQGLVRKFTPFITNVPKRHIVIVGKLLGTLAYFLDKIHRSIVKSNLQFTHPEWSKDRIRKLTMRVFQNSGIMVLEVLQMTFFSREDILRKVRIRGKENLLSALKHPKGVIMISAHLGNWEMATLFGSCYFQKPVVAVAKPIKSKILERWISPLRTRFGITIIDKKGALPQMIRTLHRGKILGLLIDQGTKRSKGVEVTFFGRTTTATLGAALLARRYGSPVLPAFCIREADGTLTLIVKPPLTLMRTHDSRADIQTNTQIMTDAVEEAVKSYPEQWFWFHKRWKRHYPHLYPGYLAGQKRRRDKKKAQLKNL